MNLAKSNAKFRDPWGHEVSLLPNAGYDADKSDAGSDAGSEDYYVSLPLDRAGGPREDWGGLGEGGWG